jgi:hypothetical protein
MQVLLECCFNFKFRYIYDVLSLNNSRFGDFVDRIYPIELEIKDTTDTDRSASYLASIKEILIGTRSSGISYHLRDKYSICICCWNVATYKWKVRNGKIEIISFVVKFRS